MKKQLFLDNKSTATTD